MLRGWHDGQAGPLGKSSIGAAGSLVNGPPRTGRLSLPCLRPTPAGSTKHVGNTIPSRYAVSRRKRGQSHLHRSPGPEAVGNQRKAKPSVDEENPKEA